MKWELKMMLDKKGITQEQLAEAVGVSQPMISYFIRGYKDPSVAVLKRMADYLGVSMDDLVSADEMAVQKS